MFVAARRVILLGFLCLSGLVVASCGTDGGSLSTTTSPCSLPKGVTATSAAISDGGKAIPGVGPAWSSTIGPASVAVGGRAFGRVENGQSGGCVFALDVKSGKIEWASKTPSNRPIVFGLTADSGTTLASVGKSAPEVGGGSFAVDELVAFDSATGQERWAFSFPDDVQGIPALLASGTVVVTETDGSVVGLRETDGHKLWRDVPPSGCSNSNTTASQPNAVAIGVVGGPVHASVDAVVGYTCPGGGSVVGIDPVNGAAKWRWSVPQGWTPDTQLASTIDTGSQTGYLVAVPISPEPPVDAPSAAASAPRPSQTTKIANVYDYSESNDVVMLDPKTGHVLWDLVRVAGQDLETLGGAGSVCVLTDTGIDCRRASDGSPRWSRSWPGEGASAAHPPLGCVDSSSKSQPCVANSKGLLYVALATNRAPVYPLQPGPPSTSGSFDLAMLNMATGKTIETLPLPSFNNTRSDHPVSLGVPPGVLAVADGMALVSPQFQETAVIQAFAMGYG